MTLRAYGCIDLQHGQPWPPHRDDWADECRLAIRPSTECHQDTPHNVNPGKDKQLGIYSFDFVWFVIVQFQVPGPGPLSTQLKHSLRRSSRYASDRNTAIHVVHQQRPKCHWHAVARGKQAWIGWHQARHYVALRNRPREQNKEKCNDSQVNTHSNAHPRQVLSPLHERVKPLWKERIKKRKYQSLEIPGSTCVPMCLTIFWWREAVIWIAPGGIQWNCRPWPQCQHYESSGWINQSYVVCNE